MYIWEGGRMIDLDKLEQLAKAATPGPWIDFQHRQEDKAESVVAEFISAANPAAIMELIAEIRRLRCCGTEVQEKEIERLTALVALADGQLAVNNDLLDAMRKNRRIEGAPK